MGKKLELMWDVGKNIPTALYESACALSIAGGVVALPVAGAIALSGDSETAKQVAAIGELGISGGFIGSIVRLLPYNYFALAAEINPNEYTADLLAQQSLAIERILWHVQNYRQERKENSR